MSIWDSMWRFDRIFAFPALILSLTLFAVPAQSEVNSNYLARFVKQQRENYQQQSWPKFFGFARFYRERLLKEEPHWVNADLLALEILALAKHCQWTLSEMAAQKSFLLMASEPDRLKIRKAYQYMLLMKGSNRYGTVTQATRFSIPLNFFSSTQYKEAEELATLPVQSPNQLQVFLPIACEDRT